MTRIKKMIFTLIPALMLLLAVSCGGGEEADGGAAETDDLTAARMGTAQALKEMVTEPSVSSAGGEWTVMALSKSGCEIDDSYYEEYYQRVCDYVSGNSGNLSDSKYTEYARVSIALNVIGKDPTDVAGYDLLEPMTDSEFVMKQGINGPIFALIAAAGCGYEMDESLQEEYLKHILESEVEGGGFSFESSMNIMDVDITAMALQALAFYKEREDVVVAADRAVDALAQAQQPEGGYDSAESNAQVIIALTALGIDPRTDERFVAEGKSPVDTLLSYRLEDGMFCHEKGSGGNLMATEQALCALDSLALYDEGELFYAKP